MLDFSGKKTLQFNVISVTRRWVDVKSNFQKKNYVTLEWPRTLNMHDLMAPAIVHKASINRAT